MEFCCVAPHPSMVEAAEPMVEEDPVARSEFDAAIRRLEKRMEQLEMQLRPKVPVPETPLPTLPETTMLGKAQPPTLKICEAIVGDEGEVSDAPGEDSVEKAELPEQTSDQIKFGESVWSLPLVLDFRRFPLWDSIFAMLLFLMNLGMQAMFSSILLSDDFADAGVQVEEERENARRWRVSIAHDWRHMDLSERSLVTRVCQSDGALILSTPQAELIDQINSFLGLGPEDFEPGFLQPGIFLCSICILHWGLCVYKEFRSVWLALEAVLTIPRASQSTIIENRLASLSTPRLVIVLFSFALRIAIASIMLVAGVNWLGRTTSITELMLNAVALNGIMDVDELLFVGFIPVSVRQSVRKLEAIKMKYSRSRSQCESFGLFLLLGATMLVPYLLYLEPLTAGMISIKWEMCGGNQTFVVANNPEVQQIIGYRTQEARNDQEPTLSEIAVDRHKFQEGGSPEYIFFSASRALFSADIDEDMSTASARVPSCIETEMMSPGAPGYGDPILSPILDARMRSALVSLGQAPGTSCEGIAHLCSRPDARLLRLMCGDTCGCTDPFSSPWHKVPSQGCSTGCNIRTENILATQPCEDQPRGDVWKEFRDGYAAALSEFYGTNVSKVVIWPTASDILRQLEVTGCSGLNLPELQLEVISQTPWCQGHDRLFRPLAWLCPRSCGCVENPSSHCPVNCKANASG